MLLKQSKNKHLNIEIRITKKKYRFVSGKGEQQKACQK